MTPPHPQGLCGFYSISIKEILQLSDSSRKIKHHTHFFFRTGGITTRKHNLHQARCGAPLKQYTNLVMSDRCPNRSAGSSSLSSCPFYTDNCTEGSVWVRPWRSGTRPWPPGRPPYWSCSPFRRPRTAASCGTWSCTPALSDTVRWPSHNPAGWPRHAGSPRQKTTHLEIEAAVVRLMHVKQLNATLEVVRLGSSSFRTLRAAFRDFQCCKLLASHKEHVYDATQDHIL